MKATFFKTPTDFRKWFEKHHDKEQELLVGFYKRDSGKLSITWPESVDEALCFGWIDGIRRSLGETSYTIRFTPRRARSTWSAVNIKRVGELTKQGLMMPSGLEAFAARKENRSGIYSYEQRTAELPEPYQRLVRRIRLHGSFLRTSRRRIGKPLTGGCSARRKKKPDSAGSKS